MMLYAKSISSFSVKNVDGEQLIVVCCEGPSFSWTLQIHSSMFSCIDWVILIYFNLVQGFLSSLWFSMYSKFMSILNFVLLILNKTQSEMLRLFLFSCRLSLYIYITGKDYKV